MNPREFELNRQHRRELMRQAEQFRLARRSLAAQLRETSPAKSRTQAIASALKSLVLYL